MKETCKSCGKVMSPIDAMMGDTCGECCRHKHKEVVTDKPTKRTHTE